MTIKNETDMKNAAQRIEELYGCSVLLKGGHSINDASDLLCSEGEYTWFHAQRINNPNTHGTGCTLSSAIASNLAKGYLLTESIKRSKEYITACLSGKLNLGSGSGPLDHMTELKSKFIE